MFIGLMFLVPIALFGLDVAAVVLSNSFNDHLAKNAARAAANQKTPEAAKTAAQQAVARLQTSPIIVAIKLDDVNYKSKDQVSVKTHIEVKLPAPFPGFAERQFIAQATEPVVGTPADL